MDLPFSSTDGARLVGHVIEVLQDFGAVVRQIGVYPLRDGLVFVADVNGRVVSCETRPGPVAYRHVAEALLTATLAIEPVAVVES
jgi:hypothetical protein